MISAELLRRSAPPVPDDPALHVKAGCFVSLHRMPGHHLRGCIGHLQSDQPLGQTVVSTSRSVLRDPRFADRPVRAAELPKLELELSVLSPLRDREHALDFDPAVDGLQLQVGDASGCFLPQVARQTGWTREQLLTRLCTEKLRLPPDAWRGSDAKLRTFTVTVLGPFPMKTQLQLIG